MSEKGLEQTGEEGLEQTDGEEAAKEAAPRVVEVEDGDVVNIFNPYFKQKQQISAKDLADGLSMRTDYTRKTQEIPERVREQAEEGARDILEQYANENPDATLADVARHMGLNVSEADSGAGAGAGEPNDKTRAMVEELARRITGVEGNVYMAMAMGDIRREHPDLFRAKRGENATADLAQEAFYGIVSNAQKLAQWSDGTNDVRVVAAKIAKQFGEKEPADRARELAEHAKKAGKAPAAAGGGQGEQITEQPTFREKLRAALQRGET